METRSTMLAGLLALTLLLTTGTATADEIELTTGEVLHGRLVELTEQQVVFEHPVLGELTVPREQVTRFHSEPAADGELDADGDVDVEVDDASQPADGDAPEVEPDAAGLLARWDSTLTLGFSGTRGNTRSQSFNTQFRTLKEDDDHRWIAEANYFYGRDNGIITQNEFRAELTKDWLFPESPWFYFARANYQYDQFQPWRQRVGGYGGFGYEFIKREDLELVGRVGLGGTYEFEGGRGFTPEALLGASLLRWHITENQTLTGSATLYPNLEDRGEFRLDNGVEWTLRVSHADNLSIKLGLENQYESAPAGDGKHNNLKYYGGIVFEF